MLKAQEIDVDYMIGLAIRAGKEIMAVYLGDIKVEYKADHSPLTAADRRANKVIIDGILSKYPNAHIISEENKEVPFNQRKNWSSFWLVDPLDGTKEFIKRNGEFTVNIALIENGIPTFGIVYAPVLDTVYYGIKDGGSYKILDGEMTKLEASASYLYKDIIKIVASRSHLNQDTIDFVEYLEAKGKKTMFVPIGSSLKICLVAEGSADVYPRFGPTSEWDTGAAHAVALYAGKQVLQAGTNLPLIYNKEILLNPSFIVG